MPPGYIAKVKPYHAEFFQGLFLLCSKEQALLSPYNVFGRQVGQCQERKMLKLTERKVLGLSGKKPGHRV